MTAPAETVRHVPSRGCYQRGCRNAACRQANYRYMSALRLDYHRGQQRRMDAAQTRVHLERLVAAGWTRAQIARAARINRRVATAVLAGQPTVAKDTARAVLNVPIGPPPDDARDVDATGTRRRVQALVAIGWPIAQLAPRFGLYVTALGHIANGTRTHVRGDTAETVAAEYRRLACLPGPSARARAEAARKGWVSPVAWDDIDDPACQPETDELSAARQARVEDVAELSEQGLSSRQIADRLSISQRTVDRARATYRTVMEVAS